MVLLSRVAGAGVSRWICFSSCRGFDFSLSFLLLWLGVMYLCAYDPGCGGRLLIDERVLVASRSSSTRRLSVLEGTR